MKTIITAVIAIICVVAGAAGGHFLKTGGGGSATAEAASDSDKHVETSDKDDHGKSDKSHGGGDSHSKSGHGDSHSKAAAGDMNYFRFSREFVVPLMRNERVASLVILNISLETDTTVTDKMFLMEPKLRDNIMTTLVHLSNDGSTLSALTSVDNYERVRGMILNNLENVVPSGIQNVLILDAAKQDL